jgi:hypothetical protein
MPSLRAVVDGGGGAVEGSGVLLGPLPGAGLPSAVGVAERRYGNAIAERLAGTIVVLQGSWERAWRVSPRSASARSGLVSE